MSTSDAIASKHVDVQTSTSNCLSCVLIALVGSSSSIQMNPTSMNRAWSSSSWLLLTIDHSKNPINCFNLYRIFYNLHTLLVFVSDTEIPSQVTRKQPSYTLCPGTTSISVLLPWPCFLCPMSPLLHIISTPTHSYSNLSLPIQALLLIPSLHLLHRVTNWSTTPPSAPKLTRSH